MRTTACTSEVCNFQNQTRWSSLCLFFSSRSSSLLFDDGLVERDQGTDSAAYKNALIATVESRVDSRDSLEVDEASKGNVLRVNNVRDKRLGNVESQGVKGVSEVCSVTSASSWLASQVEEVRGEERHEKTGESPDQSRAPEGAREQKEQVRNQNWVLLGVEEAECWDSECITVGEDLFAEKVGLERNDECLDTDNRAEGFTCRLRSLDDTGIIERTRDLASYHRSATINGFCDHAWRRWERHT